MNKKKNVRLRLIVALVLLMFGAFFANFILASSYTANPTIRVSGASTDPYGNVVGVSDASQALATVKIECSSPSTINREADPDVQYQCTATLSYSATTQPVSWDSPPTGCSATPDPSSWSSGNVFTIEGVLNTPGYYKIDLTGSIQGTDSQGNDYAGTSSVTTVYMLAAGISSVTVISGATQQNMLQDEPDKGDINWGCVKTPSSQPSSQPATQAVVRVVTNPDTDDVWKKVDWGNDGGSPVTGHDNERSYSEATSRKITVRPSLLGVKTTPLYIWVIWVDVTIDINKNDKLDPKDVIPNIDTNGNFDADFGGGTSLGTIDHDSVAALQYAYAMGKMQETGVLSPAGVESVVNTNAWNWVRTIQCACWDNLVAPEGGIRPAGSSDGPNAGNCLLDPTKTGGKIFNIDLPSCSAAMGVDIFHNSDTYANFTQYATVTLDALYTCSDQKTWSYEGEVDVDKPVGKRVQKNQLSFTPINPFPTKSCYAP